MTSRDIDKRRHPRARASLTTNIHSMPGGESDLELVTIDISLGGARCAGNRPIEPDTTLRLHFRLEGGELPKPETVSVEATVRRCIENLEAPEHRRYEIAMQFLRLESEARRMLQTYLNSL